MLALTQAMALNGPNPLLGSGKTLEVRLLGREALDYFYLDLIHATVVRIRIQNRVVLIPLELTLHGKNALF